MTEQPTTAAGQDLRRWLIEWGAFREDTTDDLDRRIGAIEAEARQQDGSALRERIAAIEHEQWEKWSREIAEQGLTPERVERWGRYWVPYEQLDEATKDHDRVWADKVLAALPPSAPPAPEEVQ